MNLKEAFREWNKAFNKEVLRQPAYKQAKASGNFERFLLSSQSLVIKGKSFVKLGTEYTREIDRGRMAGKLPPVQNLYDWLGYKKYGLTYETDAERWSLAWAIAKTMAKQGGYKFRNVDKRTEIIDKALQATLPSLQSRLEREYRVFYESEVIQGMFND